MAVYRQPTGPSPFNGVRLVSNGQQHPIRTYQPFINAAQSNYQTIQVPMNHLTQLNQFNALNQQYAIVQSPNKSMMAVTLLPKQQINQIPVILQPNQMHQQQQPSVLQLNQNFNNNNSQMMANNMSIQNIKTINNITHINNNAVNHQTLININNSNSNIKTNDDNNKGRTQNILSLPALPIPALSDEKKQL